MSEPANELREALENFAAEMARALVPLGIAASKVLQVLANDPVVRFAMEHPELLRPTERPGSCHCLCGHAHPGFSGICTGEAITERRFSTEGLGDVDVPLCGPCAVAGRPVSA